MAEWSKEKLINALEHTILPPLNARTLETDSVSDYQTRLTREGQFVSELYHENSKLNEFKKENIVNDNVVIKEVIDWCLLTACNIEESVINKVEGRDVFKKLDDFSPPIRDVIRELGSDEGLLPLFYSIGMLVLNNEAIYRFLPRKDYLMREKSISDEEKKELLGGINYSSYPTYEDGFIFLVGIPWRKMVFYGQRGYREMLLDAGCLLQVMQHIGRTKKIATRQYTLFYDSKINNLLNLDGVETYVLGIVSISCA